jgi:hypothetical protein
MQRVRIFSLLILAACNSQIYSQFCFNPATTYSVGNTPWSITKGDFNLDGKTDLAVANFSSNNVSILSGNGSGGFSAAVNFTVGNGPRFITCADFNGDSNPDLATADYNADAISVLLGNGTGSFTPFTAYACTGSGVNPASIANGDFNMDGNIDLAVGDEVSSNMSIFLGNGVGSFSLAGNYTAAMGTECVITDDFNNDGIPDLGSIAAGPNFVVLQMGTGTGSFPSANVYSCGGGSPRALTAGDFNGDGKRDVATTSSASGNLCVLLGAGTGSLNFSAIYSSMLSNAYGSILNADYNLDGKLDIAAGPAGTSSVALLRGLGTGTFSPPVYFSLVSGNASSMVNGDFNADGKMDIASANNTGNTISVLLNCTSTSGIMDVFLENGLEVFPNPASEFLNFNLRNRSIVEIYNMKGEKLFTQLSEEGYHKIFIGDYSDGIYFYKIAGKVNCNGKFVKQDTK